MSLLERLIPETERNDARFSGEIMSEMCWREGQRGAHWASEVEKLKRNPSRGIERGIISAEELPELMSIQVMDVYAMLAMDVGRSVRTVRDWVSIAEFYGRETRERYDPPLRFAHFRKARELGGTLDKATEILDITLRRMDARGGRLPSCDWMDANFRGMLLPDADRIEQVGKVVGMYDLTTTPIRRCDNIDPVVYDVCYGIDRIANYLKTAVGKMPLSDMVRGEMLAAVENLVTVWQKAVADVSGVKS